MIYISNKKIDNQMHEQWVKMIKKVKSLEVTNSKLEEEKMN